MDNTSKAMVSRSLRLKKETLVVLQQQAELQGLGITVYIRRVLESLVDNLQNQEKLEQLTEELGLYESRTV
jgi:hypothetical protein